MVGPIVLTIGRFVFSTILGWSYYGEKAAEYLFGSRVITPYRWFVGCNCDCWDLLPLFLWFGHLPILQMDLWLFRISFH